MCLIYIQSLLGLLALYPMASSVGGGCQWTNAFTFVWVQLPQCDHAVGLSQYDTGYLTGCNAQTTWCGRYNLFNFANVVSGFGMSITLEAHGLA